MVEQMSLQKIIDQKDQWFAKGDTYVVDSDWIEYFESPSYPAFKWWRSYNFISLRLYFYIATRENTEETISKVKDNLFKCKYSITIGGAISSIPLSINHWEYRGSPWQGHSPYIDLFYFGRIYKKFKEEYNVKGIPSYISKGFNDLNEAEEFVEMWKSKIMSEHEELIEEDRKILEIINKKPLKNN